MLWRSSYGPRKYVHYPKRSGRKTACGMSLLWAPSPPKPSDEEPYWVHAEWALARKNKQPINTTITLRFNQVTCADCRKSALFFQDMAEYDLSGVSWTDWESQFTKG